MAAVDVTTLSNGDDVLSASFSHSRAGRLRVVFQAGWRAGGGDLDSNGTITLRCYLGSGVDRQTALISGFAATATLELDYPGGLVAVPLGMEYAAHTVAGPIAMWMERLVCACELKSTVTA